MQGSRHYNSLSLQIPLGLLMDWPTLFKRVTSFKPDIYCNLIKLYRPRGLNPVVDQREELPLLPPCEVMDRDSTGETLSTLYTRQAEALPDNVIWISY